MTPHTQVEPGRNRDLPTCVNSRADISVALTVLLTDMFVVYLKTKYFQLSGPQLRDFHLLLDEQAIQILATTHIIAERVPKRGGQTIKSTGDIDRLQHIEDDDAAEVAPQDMLLELLNDNRLLTEQMRGLHALCDDSSDVASASLIETWIDEAQGRVWFLLQAARMAPRSEVHGS
jgi:starvation-inducible DNA-binding protein